MVNRVILIGHLGKDPEVKHLESGVAVAKFSLATNESYRDKEGKWQDSTEWHDIVVWRQLAERAESVLKKGDMVYVEGKLSSRTWQDQQGVNHRSTEVVSNYFRKITGKRDDEHHSGEGKELSGTGSHDDFSGRMAAEGSVPDDGGLPF
jgi:single-strand DNA-binding protein